MPPTGSERVADTIVIGAGLAGLACAGELIAQGREVLVVEAKDRSGGRVLTARADSGTLWELGAQVVHGRDNPVLDLLDEAPLSYRDSEFRVLLGGVSRPIGVLARLGLPPWSINSAAVAESGLGTMGEWLAGRGLDPLSGSVAGAWLEQDWSARPADLDRQELVDVVTGRPGSTDQVVPAGGFGAMVDRLARGVQVRRGAAVRRIAQSPSGVRVELRTGRTLLADNAVLAVPPWTVATSGPATSGLLIDGLPDAKNIALRHLRAGDAIVAVITTNAVSPHTISVFDADGHHGFFRCRTGSPDVQIVAKGAGAARVRSLLSHPSDLIAVLANALPHTSGSSIDAVNVADWGADPYIGGAFTVPIAGSGAASATWARPWGALCFAGEATSGAAGVARLSGALSSGLRAAREITEITTTHSTTQLTTTH